MTDTPTSPSETFHGWRMVGAGFTVLFVVYGLQFSFGTFVDDIVEDTGWSETRLQLIYGLYILAYSIMSAVSGVLTDRLGPRRVVGVGGAVLASGYLIWAIAPNIWIVLIGLGLIAPIGMSGSWVPCNATVVRWFVERRGTAVALTTVGGSLANIAVPPLAAALIAAFGWRVALGTLASVGGLVMVGVAQLLRRDPESVGQVPDGRVPVVNAAGETAPIERSLTAAEAFRTRAYWLIFATYSLSFVVVFVPFAHLNQYAADLGIAPVTAATVVSSIGIGGIVGRLVAGPLSDRTGRRTVVAVAFALEAAAFVGLAIAGGLAMLYPAAALFGFSYGASVAVFPPLVGDYFGRAHAGAIVGRLFATAGSFAAVGPVVAQLVLDQSGSYRTTFMLAALTNLLAVVMMTRLPPPTLQLAEDTYDNT